MTIYVILNLFQDLKKDAETVLDFVSQNADVHFTSLPLTLHFVTSCLRYASHYTKSAVRNDGKEFRI